MKKLMPLVIIATFIAACGPTPPPTPDVSATTTAIAKSILATMTAQAPTDTPTLVPTDTPVPTSTPTPTAVPTDTLTPTDTPIPTDTLTPTPTDTSTPAPTDTPMPTNTPEPTPTATPTAILTGPCCPTPEPGKGLLWFENRIDEILQADVGPNYYEIPPMVNYISGCACFQLDPGHYTAILACRWGCKGFTTEIDIVEGETYHMMLYFKGY